MLTDLYALITPKNKHIPASRRSEFDLSSPKSSWNPMILLPLLLLLLMHSDCGMNSFVIT